MPVKKPSAKATKAKKTVSAKAPSKPVAKAASKAPAKVKAAAKPAAPKAVRKTAPARPQQAAVAKRPAPRVKEVEESDERQQAGGSLLSGPRNVQPYVSRKGEEYMSKEQLDHFRTILASWKQDLMQEVDRTMVHMKDESAIFPDPNDRATQESEFSLELRTRDRERKLIKKIDSTLERIKADDYGWCDQCGVEIGVRRLEARPTATLCIDCKTLDEIREKQTTA
jgi:DnaK suppressor protein